jgi:site-specific recombinase XerD
VIGIHGQRWIKTNRSKTNTRSSVPILPMAEEILKKYQDHPKLAGTNILLPVLSNQKLNAYLKEIADLCGISKRLTFHLSRHTFATTVTLSNGVPIESVSRMLGHQSLRTTQIYAKVLDTKIGKDMEAIREKYSNEKFSMG